MHMTTTHIEPIQIHELPPPEVDVVACFAVGTFTEPEPNSELSTGLTVAICASNVPIVCGVSLIHCGCKIANRSIW